MDMDVSCRAKKLTYSTGQQKLFGDDVDEETKKILANIPARKGKANMNGKGGTVMNRNRISNNNQLATTPLALQSDIVVDNKNGVIFKNYTFTTLMQRRMSQISNEQNLQQNAQNISKRKKIVGFNDKIETQTPSTTTNMHSNWSNYSNFSNDSEGSVGGKKKRPRKRWTLDDVSERHLNGKWCTVQLNHQFLISGYIRNIANELPKFMAIPLSIVKLTGMFYYHSSHLVLISGSMECKNTKHNQLHILGINNKKRYKIKLNRLLKPFGNKTVGSKQEPMSMVKQIEESLATSFPPSSPSLEYKQKSAINFSALKKHKNKKKVSKTTSMTVNRKKLTKSTSNHATPTTNTSPTMTATATTTATTTATAPTKRRKLARKSSTPTTIIKCGENLPKKNSKLKLTKSRNRYQSEDIEVNKPNTHTKKKKAKKKKSNLRTQSLRFREQNAEKSDKQNISKKTHQKQKSNNDTDDQKNDNNHNQHLSAKSRRKSSVKRSKSHHAHKGNHVLSKKKSLGSALGNKTGHKSVHKKNGKKKESTKKKRSDRDVSLNQYFDRYALGNCFATSISLPCWPWLRNKFKQCEVPIHERGKYCAIFRSGGTLTCNENVSKQNDIIIFNSKHLYHTHTNREKFNKVIVEIDTINKGNGNYSNYNDSSATNHRHPHQYHHHHHHNHNNNIEILKYAKPKIINGYYCELPKFRTEIEYLSVIFNECHSKLFRFGGLNLGRCVKTILDLNLNASELKWKRSGLLKKARYSCSLVNCGYYSNKIAIVGGMNNSAKEMRNVEIYDIVAKQSTSLSSMNVGRANCGSCFVTDLNQIVIGGGVKFGDGSKQIEIYDFDKDVWNIHSARTNYKHSFPTIWNDQINPNIIYIGGDNIGISGGGRNANLGFVEWIDLRDSNAKLFNVLYEDSIDRLWRFKLLSRLNAWESRALFCL